MTDGLDENQRASAEQFGRRSANYGRGHILADVSDVDHALRDLDLPPGSPALDIATGGGHTALYLARRGWAVTVGDVAPAMVDAAVSLLRQENFTCRSALFPAEQLPFADSTFALVTCRVAAHHFSSPQRFIEEAARVLVPGGHLLVIDGSVPDDSPATESWLHAVEKLRDPSHGRFLSRSEWQKLAENAGLEVRVSRLNPLKQPDLHWYFETAGTPPGNRAKVMEAVDTAPIEVIDHLRLGREDGKIVWWWPRLTLLTRKRLEKPAATPSNG